MKPMFRHLIRVATRLTRAGRLTHAAKVLKRLLSGVPIAVPVPARKPKRRRTPAMKPKAVSKPQTRSSPGRSQAEKPQTKFGPARVPGSAATSAFVAGSYTHASRTRGYKLYSPPAKADRPLPLVVMLHGCKQDPDDFATGTGMNERAGEQGFFVLYPAQSQAANPLRCWNWFKRNHQQRGSGEPALIAGMTQKVVREHGIDSQRVYVAGLSAGGAMAAIVAAAYPDIFSAVGVHSGLAPGAADSVLGAMSVMKHGKPGEQPRARGSVAGAASSKRGRPLMPVPTIVFHGDEDATVHPGNGERVISAVLESAGSAAPSGDAPESDPQLEQGVSTKGQRYTRSTHRDQGGNAIAEHWLVHGAGHAWSGGDPAGSFTDADGPDATREMLRFFFEHPAGASHRQSNLTL